jgi:hypothetical protein
MKHRIKAWLSYLFRVNYVYIVVIRKKSQDFNQVYAAHQLEDAVSIMNKFNTENVSTARLTKIEIL